MRTLIIFLLLAGICFAEDFKSSKPLNSGKLVEEIETATGLILAGKDQAGYLSTYNGAVEIRLKDRELTQEEKDKIELVISKHDVKKIEQMEKQKAVAKYQKEIALRDKFGWTDEDLETLKEIFER